MVQLQENWALHCDSDSYISHVSLVLGRTWVQAHKTKSGEVPGPGRVAEAWRGIVQFANRENQKGADFKAGGTKREKSPSRACADTEKSVEKYSKLSNERFKKLEAMRETR